DFGVPYQDGAAPFGSLLLASDGLFYCITNSGGTDSSGVLFSFDPTTLAYTKLMDFHDGSNDASRPLGSLMQASDGLLYGMTTNGGDSGVGVLFSFDPQTTTYSKLFDFDRVNGSGPFFN